MRCLPLSLVLLLGSAPVLQAQQRPAITGIAFMHVYSDDIPSAEHFYGQTMGYAEKHFSDERIFPVNRHQWIEVTPAKRSADESYLSAVGFTVADVEAMKRYLVAKGVQDVDGPQAGQLSVHDPEGNRIVFVQRGASGPEAKIAAETPLSPRAPSHRIIHAGFIVRDRAREDAFWRDLLGFRPYWYGTMHPGQVDFVSLQVPDGTDWLEYMLMASPHPTQRDFGMSDHFSLGVDHMQTVLAALQTNGCTEKMCTGIQVGVDGKIQLNLFDPDQTRVEYMEFVPVMKPCCSPFTGRHPSEQDNR